MDGIHDLGGREGYGPIDVNEPPEPFHAPWEARVLGIVRAFTRPAHWSIDWFRHVRECIGPADYLTRAYYDQWPRYHRALTDVVADMSPETLALRPAPDGWPLWATVAHTAGTRVYWLCGELGEPGAETTPFP